MPLRQLLPSTVLNNADTNGRKKKIRVKKNYGYDCTVETHLVTASVCANLSCLENLRGNTIKYCTDSTLCKHR